VSYPTRDELVDAISVGTNGDDQRAAEMLNEYVLSLDKQPERTCPAGIHGPWRGGSGDSCPWCAHEQASLELGHLQRELAIARINPEDYIDSDDWSSDCRGWSSPVPTHDMCDDPDCRCPCHEMREAT
jgi:hypothetical protein